MKNRKSNNIELIVTSLLSNALQYKLEYELNTKKHTVSEDPTSRFYSGRW